MGLVACLGALPAFSQLGGPVGTPATQVSNAPMVPLVLVHDVPAVVGSTVLATAAGLPPRARVALSWGTVAGGWAIDDGHRFRGTRFTDTMSTIGWFDVDARGRLRATFRVPEDYGGAHQVVALIDNASVARGEIVVAPTFELTPAFGPVGTPLELRAMGLDWRGTHSTWVATWDARDLGVITATGTRGTAVARFRAAGGVGEHAIELRSGSPGRTSMVGDPPSSPTVSHRRFAFRTTPGEVDRTTEEGYRPQWLERTLANVVGAMVTLEPSQGPVGTRAVLRGEGFAPHQPFSLNWESPAASRDGDQDRATARHTLEDIHADPDGRFDWPLTIPDATGGAHSVTLREGSELVARAPFIIETRLGDMTPRSGPAGTLVTIRLNGVGWTDFDRAYVATYDNGMLGTTRPEGGPGHAVISFTATGAPGPHLVDLYPGISPGPMFASEPLFRLPQLTYESDHPGAILPALRLTFHISVP